MIWKGFVVLNVLIIAISCQRKRTIDNEVKAITIDTLEERKEPEVIIDYDTTQWTEITPIEEKIFIDLKYATSDNFIHEAVYPCGRCFFKKKAAAAILKTAKSAQKADLSLTLFDCYRPRPIQQKLWDKMPNINYVAPPEKGSMHNRGITVDLGLSDKKGNLIDMGTDFDEFSRKSFTFHPFEDTTITERRKTLRRLLEKNGFRGIKTEWWHFTHIPSLGEPLEDWQWNCNETTNN